MSCKNATSRYSF